MSSALDSSASSAVLVVMGGVCWFVIVLASRRWGFGSIKLRVEGAGGLGTWATFKSVFCVVLMFRVGVSPSPLVMSDISSCWAVGDAGFIGGRV